MQRFPLRKTALMVFTRSFFSIFLSLRTLVTACTVCTASVDRAAYPCRQAICCTLFSGVDLHAWSGNVWGGLGEGSPKRTPALACHMRAPATPAHKNLVAICCDTQTKSHCRLTLLIILMNFMSRFQYWAVLRVAAPSPHVCFPLPAERKRKSMWCVEG